MAINRNDDYEKLAKLLYPSIEASGNTYYGQTRKLTLDEVFNKNNGGFESHIESVRVDNPSADYGFTYDTLFCWKVGPLNGTLKVDVEYNIGTYFAIYEIISEPVTNVNQLNSGEFNTHFNTYEYNTSCKFKEVKETGGKSPVNNTDIYDGRNFYIYKDGIKNYIAVAVNAEAEVPYDENNPLKLTAVNNTVDVELFAIYDSSNPIIDDQDHQMYEYSADNGETWSWCELSVENVHTGVTIQLNPGKSVCFRLKSGAIKQFTNGKWVRFKFTGSGKIIASGDIRSMKQNPNGPLESYEFCDLFRGCSQLIKAPVLHDKTLADSCYCGMYRGTSLLETPVLNAPVLDERCYYRMFSNCTSLRKVICSAADLSAQDCTGTWLLSVADSGEFITLNGTNWQTDTVDGIPTGWTRINISVPTEYTGEDCKHNYLVTDGSNSSENGRGSVTSNSTLYNMENSFDELHSHQMNTYNADGSFNQEVWGYKCFNSPVQFKNGIYGEQAKLVTTNETKDTSGNNSFVFHDTWDGSKLSADKASVSVLKTKNVLTNGTITQYDLSGSSTYISAGDIAYSSVGNVYTGDADNSTHGSICATTYHTGTAGSNIWTVSDVVLKSCLYNDCYSIINLSSNKNEYTDNTAINNSEIKLVSHSNTTDYAKILLNYSNTIIGNYDNSNSSYIKITPIDGIEVYGDILPSINEQYNLGDNSKKWNNFYCKYIHADNIADVERTVTTHKNGDNTSGDDQTIRGVKTFMDGVTVNDIITAVGNVNIMHTGDAQIGSLKFDGLYFTDLYNVAQSNPPLSCFKSSVTSVGTGASQSVAILAGNTSDFNNVGIHLRYQSNSLSDPVSTNIRFCIGNDDLLTAGYYSEFLKNGCYIPRLKADGLVVSKDNGIIDFRDGSSIRFWPDSNTQVSDSPGNLYRSINANTEADGELKLSKMDGTQDQIYIAEAATHAKINSSDSTKVDCPVGSIVYAILATDIDSSIVKIGTSFNINANQAVVAILTSSGYSFMPGSGKLPAGKYKAFSDINFTGVNGWFDDPVIIQRVADDAT